MIFMRDKFSLSMDCKYEPKQQGAATLVMAVVLLVIVLGISFFTADVVITEKKITANEYRAKQAFHAAQAGIDFGIAYARRGLDQNEDGVLDLTTASSASVGDAFYLLNFADVSSGADMSLIELNSVGASDDQQIKRTVNVLIGKVPLVPNPPDLPVVARSYISVSGNLGIYNVYDNLNVWSGDKLDSWGSAETYIRDPDWSGITDGDWDSSTTDLNSYMKSESLKPSDIPTIQSSTKNTRGPDIIENDANISDDVVTADAFTKNFFDKTLGDMVGEAVTAGLSFTGKELEDAANDNPDSINGHIVHLSDAKLTGGTLGTRENPIIIVVDGALDIVGSTEIWGLLIVDSVNKAAGQTDIFGGLVSQNTIDIGVGSVDIYYDEEVIESASKLYSMELVRGSWRDWGN